MNKPLSRWTPAAILMISGSAHSFAGGVFPAALELSSLDGVRGFVISGIDVGDFSGGSVSSAGDVNGDGIDDLIVGAGGGDPGAQGEAGESYVVFGRAGIGAGGSFDLASLDGANGFTLNGIDSGDFSGGSVSSAGDVNNDGIDDLIIGAGGGDPNGSGSGESYVVFGDASIGMGGTLELATLDGATGFVIKGVGEHDQDGYSSVSSAGDVNGDGVDDLIIGARYADPGGNDAGESYVVFGGAGIGASGVLELSMLDGDDGSVLNGVDPDDMSGHAVAAAGDVNGDGVDDLIIGAPHASGPPSALPGEAYVVFGGAGLGATGTLELSALDGDNGFVLNGVDARDACGWSVSSAGDVNGDGFGDLVIGAPLATQNEYLFSGECYVVYGADGIGASGEVDLGSLGGADGFIINGLTSVDDGVRSFDFVGWSVSTAGDMNSDGFSDLLVGAPSASPGDRRSAGETYVIFGGAGLGASGFFDLESFDGNNGFVCNGIDVYDYCGLAVSGAGDVNGDGVDDVIIAAPHPIGDGVSTGESYVIFGRSSGSECDLPSITQQPQPVSAALGSTIELSVESSITEEISYQWLKDGAPLLPGPRIAGVTSAQLTISDFQEIDFGSYSVQLMTPCFDVIYSLSVSVGAGPDINEDGLVDVGDLRVLLESFGPCPEGSECSADLDRDGMVSAADLVILLSEIDLSSNDQRRVEKVSEKLDKGVQKQSTTSAKLEPKIADSQANLDSMDEQIELVEGMPDSEKTLSKLLKKKMKLERKLAKLVDKLADKTDRIRMKMQEQIDRFFAD